ncbi:MAG: ribosome-associated translation inhibitor RaiA [bacterium]
MKLTITGRHFEVTPFLRKHVEEKITRLDHYSDRIHEGEIILLKDRASEIAEGRIHIGHTVFTARAESTDMYNSVNELFDRILAQLKRHDGKIRDRKRLGADR